MKQGHRLVPFCLFLLGSLTACGGDAAPARRAISAEARKEAQKTFTEICVSCHGSVGNGDGPGSTTLNPKPRAFKDAKWQDSVTDERIKKIITSGSLAVGLSPQMPAQPQLKGKDAVLDGLVSIVRSFRAN
jgi:mono/diheme cytochrome c family protein